MNNLEELKKAALGANLHGWTGFEDALNADGYSEAVSKFIGHCRPSEILDLIAQLEAAQLELIKPLPIGELLHRLEGQTYRKWYDDDELNKWRERAEKAESELSAANERLSKAVEFPDSDIAAVSHIAHWYSENQCEAWVAGVEFSKKQIIKAGFTVEGE